MYNFAFFLSMAVILGANPAYAQQPFDLDAPSSMSGHTNSPPVKAEKDSPQGGIAAESIAKPEANEKLLGSNVPVPGAPVKAPNLTAGPAEKSLATGAAPSTAPKAGTPPSPSSPRGKDVANTSINSDTRKSGTSSERTTGQSGAPASADTSTPAQADSVQPSGGQAPNVPSTFQQTSPFTSAPGATRPFNRREWRCERHDGVRTCRNLVTGETFERRGRDLD